MGRGLVRGDWGVQCFLLVDERKHLEFLGVSVPNSFPQRVSRFKALCHRMFSPASGHQLQPAPGLLNNVGLCVGSSITLGDVCRLATTLSPRF